MESGRIFDNCGDMLALLDSPNNSLWVPPSSFHETMVNFDQEPRGSRKNPKRRRGYEEESGGEESDANPYQSEKKRRLTTQQVEFLEKSFEKENKLDPERKEKLAKQLGLQSKQVAIWFQNRRARYKTKQIEKEFDTLKASYDSLKFDYDSLCMEREKLQNEVEILKKKLVQKQNNSKEGTSVTETNEKVQTKIEQFATPSNKLAEDASSAKSDIVDSESPQWTDGNQTSKQVESSSSLVGTHGPDQHSEVSVDDEEHFMMNEILLQTPPTFNNFLKVAGDGNYEPSVSSCNFSILEDWSLLY